MAANTAPIYTAVPVSSIGTTLTTANNAMDGTGTVVAVFTAGANGSYVSKIIARAQGSNTATVLRIFLNNGSTNTTASNNALIAELSMPTTTASATSALPSFEIPLGFAIGASYVLNACLGTTVAAGVICTGVGGNY